MADERITVRAELRDELTQPLERVERQVRETSEALERASRDSQDYERRSRRLSGRLRDLNRNGGRTTRTFRAVSRVTTALGEGTSRAAASTARLSGRLGTLIGRLGRLTGGTGRARKGVKALTGGFIGLLAKAVLLVTVIPVLATLIGALGVAAFVATSALGPLFGALAAAPGGVLALITSIGALKSALGGVRDASKVLADPAATADEVNAALKDLTPRARAFAELLSGYEPMFKGIREAAQEGLFPGLANALEGFANVAPVIQEGMRGVGFALGGAATQLGRFMSSPAFRDDLQTIMQANTYAIDRAAQGGVHFAKALADVMVVAAPLVRWFGELIHAAGMWAEKSAAANRASGEMAAFFDKTRLRLTQLGHILRDFGVGFYNIFRIATPMADEASSSLENLAARFRAFTESPEGVRKITEYFDAMRPVLTTLGDLLMSFGGGFFRLSKESAPQTVSVLQQLQGLGSALNDVFTAAGGSSTLASVVSILQSLAMILSALPFSVIATFAQVIAYLIGLVARLATDTGIAGGIFRGFLATIVAVKLGMALFAVGVTIFTGVLNMARGVLAAFRLVMLGVNFVMAMNPIGLVVIAIAALVAGIVIAYKKSETFRNAVKGLVDVFKRLWQAIKNIDWPDPPDWLKSVGGALGIGDTASSRAPRGGNFGSTVAQHSAIDSAIGGRRQVTNAFVGGGGVPGAPSSGDHEAGRALDLIGSNLNTYAQAVRGLGGYAAFHGSGKGRHLHAAFAAGDTSRRRAPHSRRRPVVRAHANLPIGDTWFGRVRRDMSAMQSPSAGRTPAPANATMQQTVVFQPGSVVVNNPQSGIDVRREVVRAMAERERDRRERR